MKTSNILFYTTLILVLILGLGINTFLPKSIEKYLILSLGISTILTFVFAKKEHIKILKNL